MSGGSFVFRGDLAETPFPEILATIHRYGVPGVLELTGERATKRVFMIDGDVIFATSSDREESLGQFLLRQGRLTKAQFGAACDEMARAEGRRLGTILIERSFLEPEELGPAVREQIQEILWSLFDWESGSVVFHVGRFRDDEVFKIKVPTPRAIVGGCRKIKDGRRATARLGSKTTLLAPRDLPEHLSGLRLEPKERELLGLVDGKRTLVELCQEGPFAAGVNARLLYAFTVLQMVERVGEGGGIRIQVRQGGDAE